jgi:hypothetical protein
MQEAPELPTPSPDQAATQTHSVLEQLRDFAIDYGPEILTALVILMVGWLVALLVSLVVRAALKRTKLDSKLAKWLVGEERAKTIEIEKWISRAVFYLLMMFVLVAFFEALGLTAITEPLKRFLIQIFEYAPNLLGPAILVLVAWLVATALRFFVRRVLTGIRLDEKLGGQVGLEEGEAVPLSKTLGDAVYLLVFLLFLPAVLDALNLEGLLEPVQKMINKILDFLPHLFGAGLILAVGWLLAKIVQRIVTNLLAAAGADRLSHKVGLAPALGKQKLSGLIGLILYNLILILVLVASLNTLKLDAITKPASEMLDTFLNALPHLFAAALVLLIAFLVGRVVAGLAANLLAGVGFNAVLGKLGFESELSEGQRTPAEIAGSLVMVAIMLFAIIEAVDLLGFQMLAELVSDFMIFGGHVLLGLIIFGIGLYLANIAARTILSSNATQATLLAMVARISILVLAGAMALRQMGLANEIIVLAFGILLGAVAIAIAIAFGIGGRDLAAEALREWSRKLGQRPPRQSKPEKLELEI